MHFPRALWTVCTSLMLLAATRAAQSTQAIVTGRSLDSRTGQPLPGARLLFTEHGRLADAPPSGKRRAANRLFARLPDRVFTVSDDLRKHLAAREIETEVYYPVPLHRLECFRHLDSPSLPEAERFSKEALALPVGSRPRADREREQHP